MKIFFFEDYIINILLDNVFYISEKNEKDRKSNYNKNNRTISLIIKINFVNSHFKMLKFLLLIHNLIHLE